MKSSRSVKTLLINMVWMVLMSLLQPSSISIAANNRISSQAAANFVAVIQEKNVRITVLTPALLRLEWCEDGQFEDRPSFAVINRNLEVPEFTAETVNGELIINTEKLELKYKKDSGRFTSENVKIRLKSEETPVTWHPGMEDKANLKGTARTLDGVSGAIPLGQGLVSRDGWVLFDDSKNLLMDGEIPWPTPRDNKELQDWYFFGHGHDYLQAIKDFTKISGSIPLPPMYAFGSWWSRYWAYTDEELKELVRDFEKYDLPLDVLVVDMDWHLDGWTGYTWNPDYFPNPEEFLQWCKDKNLRVTLNLHPHSGIQKHETQFEDFTRFMGKDPSTTDSIPFDISDPKYMEGYFKIVHNPHEKSGVDFWWIDWQQGEASKIPGLDPLFWLNHLHWTDMENNAERGNLRPLIFSRWGGLGNHRYQIGFSGDTFCNWESLAFQPYFTSTAANVAYSFWSHDIGGHQPGPVDGELYVRWLQFAALNPIMRTHTTKNEEAERRIWKFDKEVFDNAKKAFELRYRLLPYIYSAAYKAHSESVPLLRPLYYLWPEEEEAYTDTSAYIFGDDMFVAPVAEAIDELSQAAISNFWLPPGNWYHWYTGKLYEGGKNIFLHTPLDQIPLFIKEGAVIPTYYYAQRISTDLKKHITLEIFPFNKKGRFETYLYEDDGLSTEYLNGGYAKTKLEYGQIESNTTHFLIGHGKGDYEGKPEFRDYTLKFKYQWTPESVKVNGHDIKQLADKKNSETGWYFDKKNFQIVVELYGQDTSKEVYVVLENSKFSLNVFKSGLQGDILFIEELINDYKGKLPAEFEQYLETLKNVTPETSSEIVPLNQKMNELLEATIKSINDEKLKREIVARLTGLSSEYKLIKRSDDEYVLEIEVITAKATPEMIVDLSSDLPEGWRISQSKIETSFIESTGQKRVLSTSIECPEKDIPGILNFNLNCRFEGCDIEIPYLLEAFPSIPVWQILGPFEHDWYDSMKTEHGPEKRINLKKVFKGKNDKIIAWKRIERDDFLGLEEEFVVDFHNYFGFTENAVAYAVCNLESEVQQEVVLKLGSDDGVKIWLNNEEVYFHHIPRPYKSREDKVTLKLRKGKNLLLMKVCQWHGGWAFGAHIETIEGQPVQNVRIKYVE